MRGFGGHFHMPHFPHRDPFHRQEINRNMRRAPGRLNKTEIRIVVGVLAVVALGFLYVLVS